MSDGWRGKSWELVHNGGSADQTDRMRVDGGFLYRCRMWSKDEGAVIALVFVPELTGDAHYIFENTP